MATAAAYGHALGLPVHGVCSLDAISIDTVGEVLVVTDARRREVYWARYRDGVRVDGPAVNAPADVPGADEALAYDSIEEGERSEVWPRVQGRLSRWMALGFIVTSLAGACVEVWSAEVD